MGFRDSIKDIKFSKKMILPIFLIVIFLGSIFTVFTYGGKTSESVNLIVDFGQPGMKVEKTVGINDKSTILMLISSQMPSVAFDANGQTKCIHTYCNNDAGQWKVYRVIGNSLLSGILINNSLEKEKLNNGDTIYFIYQMNIIEEESSEMSLNESVSSSNENSTVTNLTESD